MIQVTKEKALGKLSTEQRKRFVELRRLIQEQWTKAVVEVGKALWEIRDQKLYREEFDRFEDFCRATFDLSRGRAYQLIDTAKVNENLSTSGRHEPVNERVSRELARVEPERQREVVRKVEQHGSVTGKAVRAEIDKIDKPEQSVTPKPSSSAEQLFKFAMMQGCQKMEFDFGRYVVVIIPKAIN